MKIEILGRYSACFDAVAIAEVFKTKRGSIHIKIDPTPSKETEEIYNAVNLETGMPYHFSDNEVVTKINATLIIKEH